MTSNLTSAGEASVDIDSADSEMIPGAPMRASDRRTHAARLLGVVSRRPVAAVFSIALTLRVLVVAGAHLFHHGVLVPDEAQYLQLVHYVARGGSADAWFPGYGQSLYDQTWAFAAPLVQLFKAFGSHIIIGQLWSALFGAVTAALTAYLARLMLGRRWALVAGLAVAALPSQMYWSAAMIREAEIWAALSLMAVVLVVLARETRMWCIGLALACLFGDSVALGHLRQQILVVASWALALTLIFLRPRRVAVVMVGVLAVAVFGPWLSALGPGGWRLIEKAAPSLGTTRVDLSLNANSALQTPIPVSSSSTRQPSPAGAGALSIAGRSALLQDNGHSYFAENGLVANLKAIPRGVEGFLLQPLPGKHPSDSSQLLAELENVLWWCLYALALVGIVSSRSRLRYIAFPTLIVLGIVGMSALTEGNAGTAFRQRGQILWALALLATPGAHWLVHRYPALNPLRRHRADPSLRT